MRSGYAGKIQIGVIASIVKDSVDHLHIVSVRASKETVETLT